MAFDSDADWDDPDPFDRPPRRRPTRRLPAGEDRVTAILLLVFLLVLGAILFVLVLIENLTFDANRLDGVSVLGETMWIVPGAVGLSALATLVALFRPDRSHRIWWIPVAGAAVTVVAFLVASGIVVIARR